MKLNALLISPILLLLFLLSSLQTLHAQCAAPTYVAGTTYATGQEVQNGGTLYRCDVGGWCSSSGAWAYEPGKGQYWTTAWTQIRTCGTTTPVLTTISVSPSSGSVQTGKTLQFNATGKDQNGNTLTVTPTWTVTGGGTISSSGLFTANSVGGPFTVKAQQGTVSGTASVTVTNTTSTPVLTTITVSPSSGTVQKGKTLQFTAAGKDQSGNAMSISPTWTVSGGGTISSSDYLLPALPVALIQ